jgi:hypothetical protein
MALTQARIEANQPTEKRKQPALAIESGPDPKLSTKRDEMATRSMIQDQDLQRPSNFGMDCRTASTRWEDVARGPSKAQVLAHVNKLARFLGPR